MKYFYTYKLPFKFEKTKFHYWMCQDAYECLEKAFSKYKTTEFYIHEISEESYCRATGIMLPPPPPNITSEVIELVKALHSIKSWMVNYVEPETIGYKSEKHELEKILKKYKNVPVNFE